MRRRYVTGTLKLHDRASALAERRYNYSEANGGTAAFDSIYDA
jgi:hypothetical protein